MCTGDTITTGAITGKATHEYVFKSGEPYEARVSRTVLKGAKGEIPLVYRLTRIRFLKGNMQIHWR